MPRTKHSNYYERKLLANISKRGWHCTGVFAEKDTPTFSYTVGLFYSFGFPELLVIGLPPETAYGVFRIAANAAAGGKPLDLSRPAERLFQRYPAVFVQVPVAEYHHYVLSALWYYEGTPFPLHQIVWPFKDGKFPWHPAVTAEQKRSQPVLGAHSVAS